MRKARGGVSSKRQFLRRRRTRVINDQRNDGEAAELRLARHTRRLDALEAHDQARGEDLQGRRGKHGRVSFSTCVGLRKRGDLYR
jgi:hypothetical protein